MFRYADRLNLPAVVFALSACLGLQAPLRGEGLTDDMVGQTEASWSAWQAATHALEREDSAAAVKAFDAVAAMNLSDLRLALMADRTGSVRLEQWAAASDAPPSVKALVAKIASGRKQRGLAEDGWHYAAIGRFKYANAAFKALDDSNPDPVALLEMARQNPNRHTILIKLIANADVGPAAQRFLQILNEGEERLRTDPHEIVANIAMLGGPPRMAYNATNRLKASGEYAIPHLIQFLQDGKQNALHPAIIQVIPQIGRAALNPLCIALEMKDDVTRQIIINALAQIGYRQPLPYLAKVAEDAKASGDVRAAAIQAMTALASGETGRARLFLSLAMDYYNNIESVRGDARRDTANVWYLRDGQLRLIEVPTPIFNDVMAMRCCEEALLAESETAEATALWLAANFRREAKIGLDVESDRADPNAAKDATRPENFPRAIYFARAAGPKYNHRVLAWAFADRDPGVALGAIAALRETAGEPSLVGEEDVKQPMVSALAFPNRQVRIKAALALGAALPKTSFAGCENVVPVLAEALVQSGRQSALIVDPDAAVANKFQALLRSGGFDCAVGANLNAARENGRKANIAYFDIIFLASDMAGPDVLAAVNDLRKDLPTAATPILVVTKQGDMGKATSASRFGPGIEILLSDVVDMGDPQKINEQVMARVARASQALGMIPLGKELSLSLALQSADVLRAIAESNLKVYDYSRAVPALITSLASPSEPLRVKCARVLALAGSVEAQTAILEAAFNAQHAVEERVTAFQSLAEAGRRNGNLLGANGWISKLVDFTMNEKDLTLRIAASQALGALNLSSNKASEIIRNQYRG